MAPPRKHPARRQRRNKKPKLTLDSSSTRVGTKRNQRDRNTRSSTRESAPDPPDGLLKATRDKWIAYWDSEISNVVRAAHMPALERMFLLMDELERTIRAVRRRGRMAKGSQGQQVQSPLLKYMDSCSKEIRALEDRFGLTPSAMQKMGGLGDLGRSLDDLNSDLERDADEDPRRLKAVK